MSSTEDKPKSKIPAHLRGVFINGRRVITKGCGATLRTIDPCFMPNGKIQKFDNVALDSDAIQESTFVFVNNQPVLTLNSKLKTTYGSEAASAGVKSGTIAGECTFLTGSPNTFAEGFAIIRDGDLALANNANTEPAPMVHPDRYILKEDSLVEYQALKEAHPIPSTAPLAIKFVYTYGKPLAYQNCVLRLKTSQRLLGVDLKEGVGVIPLTAIEKAEDTLIIDNFEMIDVQSGFPTHYQEIPLKGRDEILIELLPPPIVVNLREPPRSCEKTPSLLSKQAIQYFLDNGQNALIFIHGYNVPLGQLGHYLKDYEISSKHLHLKASPYRRSIACDINHPAEICTQFPDLAPSYRSLFKKASSHEDPEGEHPFSELLNGSGCSKWFNLMEYNFNKAAGFSQDYKQYTRIINVLWKGNEGAANFSKAIDNAKFHGSNECGLISLLRQLYTAQIETNIVAHSLGSAFLLQALEQLGQSKEKLVNKVILWQAAIPKTIFTNDKSHYHDTRLNSRFPHIFNACQSINVLFSEKDLVLKLLYPLSQYLPYSLEEILNFSTQKVHQKIIPVWKALFIEEIANHLQNTVQILKLSEAQIQDLFKEIAETAYLTSGLLATQDYNPILVMVRQASYYEFQWTTRFSKEFIWRSNPENPPALNEYYHNIGLDEGVYRPLPEIRHHSHEYLEKIKNYNERARKAKYTFAKAAYKTLLIVEKRFSAEGALGYKGADWTPYIDRLEKSKTLLQVNQKDYLAGHSYMKRPTEALMEEIYKKFVIGPKGIIRFGKYPIKK